MSESIGLPKIEGYAENRWEAEKDALFEFFQRKYENITTEKQTTEESLRKEIESVIEQYGYFQVLPTDDTFRSKDSPLGDIGLVESSRDRVKSASIDEIIDYVIGSLVDDEVIEV